MRIKQIKKLIKLLENTIATEIEITDFWGRKIKVSKSNSTASVPQHTAHNVIIEEKKETGKKKSEDPKDNWVAIRSPIVGTFYRAPSPDSPPYIEVGDIIKPGQVVCVVEAMKLMNEIEADVAGRIVQILTKNEEPVEYNQELFYIEPL